MKPHEMSEDRKALRAKIARLYGCGFSLHDIAQELGCTAAAVHYHMKRAGIPRRSTAGFKDDLKAPVEQSV